MGFQMGFNLKATWYGSGRGQAKGRKARPRILLTTEKKELRMAQSTPATKFLDKLKVPYTVHSYDYDPDPGKVGLQAAAEMGVPPAQVFKTLMVLVDGAAACVLAPSDCQVNMKQLALLAGGKRAGMMPPEAAEKFTAYKVGGISPLGQKRAAPVFLDASAFNFESIYINGGQRGLQILIAPHKLVEVLRATAGAIAI